jgi:hypothetical protein
MNDDTYPLAGKRVNDWVTAPCSSPVPACPARPATVNTR